MSLEGVVPAENLELGDTFHPPSEFLTLELCSSILLTFIQFV